MFDAIETESKDAVQLCAPVLQLLNGNLMTLIQKDFACFSQRDPNGAAPR